MLGTKLKYTTAFHTRGDGQTEVVNRSLGNILYPLVGEHDECWDLKLFIVHIIYLSTGQHVRVHMR